MIWTIRILWAVTPITIWGLLDTALENRSAGISWLLIIGLGVLWLIGVAATVYPHSLSLLAIRILAPLPWVVCVWAVIFVPESGAHSILNLALGFIQSTVFMVLALSAYLGSIFVAAEAYGQEERFLMRAPTPIYFALMPLAWTVSIAGLASGPLLLAAERWALGGILLPIGLLLSASIITRSLNSLTLRQVIFVPNGLVISDPLSLEFPIRLEASQIKALDLRRTSDLKKMAKNEAVLSENTINFAQSTAGEILCLTTNPPVQAYLRGKQNGYFDTLIFAPTLLPEVQNAAKKRFSKLKT